MTKFTTTDPKQQVMEDARAYRISVVLFRHMVAQQLGVNITDMECLSLVYFNGLAKPSELSENTGLSTGSTTAMIDRLEKSGLIMRKPNPDDRRSTLIAMTKSGAKKIEALFKPVRHTQKELLKGYSEQEMRVLSDFFQRSTAMWTEQREKLSK
jgi:DNA-binding MarR family transcriptional regulator